MYVDEVMAELRERVRERLRHEMLRSGGSRDFEDPALFADVERLLHIAAESGDGRGLLLPELLGDPGRWRLQTALEYQSHRGTAAARVIIGVKRYLLMPVFRWLFEYSRENFLRQRHVNHVLFACVQELALETARLRQELHKR